MMHLSILTSLVLLGVGVLGDDCQSPNWKKRAPVPAGQMVCRYWVTTGADVNYYTCTELSDGYWQTVENFFTLNPQLKTDCSNIQPNTKYCMKGFIQPVISTDGFCGPKHGNATCIDTGFGQCCNSQTWKCGNTAQDCEPGTCYTGLCHGADEYAIDGLCGKQHKNLLCGGKWGECCNNGGVCGNGASFCGVGKCQSGNCAGGNATTSSFPTLPVPTGLPWLTGSGKTTTTTTSKSTATTTTNKSSATTSKKTTTTSKSTTTTSKPKAVLG